MHLLSLQDFVFAWPLLSFLMGGEEKRKWKVQNLLVLCSKKMSAQMHRFAFVKNDGEERKAKDAE